MTRFATTPAFAMRHICRSLCLGSSVVLLVSACQAQGPSPADRPPIIDMHLHAHSLTQYGGGMPNCANDQEILFPGIDPREPITLGHVKTCASPMAPAATDEVLMVV